MLISELECRLKELRERYGDIPVRLDDGMGFHELIGRPYVFMTSRDPGDWYALIMSKRLREQSV